MAVQVRFTDDEVVLWAETEEDLALALDAAVPFVAPPEIAERFGIDATLEEDVGDPEDLFPGPDDPPVEPGASFPIPGEPDQGVVSTLLEVAAWAAVFTGLGLVFLEWIVL